MLLFLGVGHTKNAADRLFNLLKTEYRRNNIFTMNCLITALSASRQVTILPTEPQDFLNYDKLFNDIYRKLDGKIKQNHIFACVEGDRMDIRESNLEEHEVNHHKMSKRGCGLLYTDSQGSGLHTKNQMNPSHRNPRLP